MRILHNTPDLLVIEHNPIKWMVIFGAIVAVFVIGGIGALIDGNVVGWLFLGMMALLSWVVFPLLRLIRVRLRRPDGVAELRITSLLGHKDEAYPLAQLAGAEAEVRYGKSNSQPESQMVLVFRHTEPATRIRLDAFQPDPEDVLHVTETVNGWLKSALPRHHASPNRSEERPA